MTGVQVDDVVRLCSGVFNIDYAYLMHLCPVRTHVLGYVEDKLVAHALWLDRRIRLGDGPWFVAAYVEGVATHPEHRRQGYGEAVMRRLQADICGYPLGVLSPAVEPWYVKLGWERWHGSLWIDQDGETDETTDETVLVYRTPTTSALDLTIPLTAEWRPFELW
jgi:aminoglycoside 2'-N-acetyltransferase I